MRHLALGNHAKYNELGALKWSQYENVQCIRNRPATILLRFTIGLPSASRVSRPLSRTANSRESPVSENRLLAALATSDYTRITARMTNVTFGHKEVAYLPGGTIDFVYFPTSGVVSATIVMLDGQLAETAVIGREGLLGLTAFLGASRSPEQVFCQIAPADCRKMPVADFTAEVAKGGRFTEVIHAYTCGVLLASAQCTACNALHSIDERFARWLLMCHDRVGADEFPLTHEFLSIMLGVRRATVSVTAASLQSAGMIAYRHGKVTIRDRSALEEAACECYLAIRDAFV
jgi:CRP-like cAMP-binding protein